METFDVQAPCFALLKDKALLHIHSASSDFLCHVIAYGERSVLDAQQKVVVPLMDDEDEKNIEALIRLIWRHCASKPFLYTVVSPLLEALFAQYAALSERAQLRGGKTAANRKEELFRGFLALVSEHWLDERELAWYADALCISVHYLCEAVQPRLLQPFLQAGNRPHARRI